MRALLAFLALSITLAAAPARAELRGKVYLITNPEAAPSEWRRRPLPGAFVAVSWTVVIPGPGHAVDSCRYREIARTDDNGEFVVEGPNFLTAAMADASYEAYSPGLDWVEPYPRARTDPKDITMALSRRSPAERLSNIALRTDPGCSTATLRDPRALLVPYLRALVDEAKTLNVDSERGRMDVRSLETALRRATGGDRPQPLRVIVVPPSAGSASPQPR